MPAEIEPTGDHLDSTPAGPPSTPSSSEAVQRLLAIARFIAFAVLFFVLEIALIYLLRTGLRGHSFSLPARMAASEFILVAAALLATAIMAKLQRRSFLSFGLGGEQKLQLFISGGIAGFVLLTLLLAGLRVSHHFYFGSPDIHGTDILKFGAIYFVVFSLVALAEETMFRGYALYTLTEGITFWPAAILLACLFGYVHRGNPGESPVGTIAAGTFGLVIAFAVRRTGSLWWPIGFHLLWDYSESFIYGVPDSGMVVPGHLLHAQFIGPNWITGGSVGPEGSYFVFLILLLLAIWIHLAFPQRRMPV